LAQRAHGNPQKRFISLGLVGAIHVAAIYALVDGLIPGIPPIIQPGPMVVDAMPSPPPKPQPPVHVDLTTPQMPYYPPPDFTTQSDAAGTITVTHRPPPDMGGATLLPSTEPPAAAQGIAGTHTIPPYPEMAIRLAQQGTVTLRLSIGPDGMVDEAQVENSSGSSLLDDAAVAWVKGHWRYKAATKEGSAIASTMLAAVRFDLKNAR
jgi:protein TonB